MSEETALMEERKESPELPMEQPPSPPRRRPGIAGAVILISLGVALLLDNLGVVSISWLEVIRYWPVLLIVGGIDLLFGSRSIWGSVVAGFIALVAIGAILFFSWSSGPGLAGNLAGTSISGDIQESLGDAASLDVNLDIGAAQTNIGVLHGNSDTVQGTYETDSRFEISTEYQMRGDKGVFTITQTGDSIGFPEPAPYIGKLDLSLPEDIPTSINVNAGVGEMTLDLGDLTLTSLSIDAGLGATTITLPATGGYSVNLSAGVGSLDIVLPAGVEALVNFDGGLTDLNVDSRFEKIGDGVWQTAGYSTAGNGVVINISAGVGSVTINQ